MKGNRRQIALLAAGLLVVGIGLCLFHGNSDQHHGHATPPDLCASVMMILATPLLLTGPLVSGWVVAVANLFLYAGPADILDRPPEAFSLS